MSSWPARTNQEAGWQVFIFVLLVDENERGTYLRVRHVSMTLSQLELALLGGLPLRKLDQLIARGHAPIYARPQSRRVACYTLHEAIMLVTGMLLHERYSLSWPLIHHAIALNPELFMDPLDEADGATGSEERWLAMYDEPRSAAVGRLTELPIPRASSAGVPGELVGGDQTGAAARERAWPRAAPTGPMGRGPRGLLG